jgi:katanin p80 WD40 repeat-containing subunit B1
VGNNTHRSSFGPLQSSVTACRFDPTETKILCGNNGGTVMLFDLNEARCASNWTAHRSAVHNLAFHPQDPKLFFSCGYDGKLHVLSTQSRRPVQSYSAHANPAHHVSVSYDGRYAATCSDDRSIRIFDLTAQRQLAKLDGHTDAVCCVEFHPTEPLLVSGGVDRSTRFWDLVAQKEIPVSFHLDSSPVEKVKFLANEGVVLTGSADYLKVIGWNPPEFFEHIPLGLERIRDIAFTDATVTFASNSGNRVLIHRLGCDALKPFCDRKASDRRPRPSTPRLLDLSSIPDIAPKAQPPRQASKRAPATETPEPAMELFQEFRKSRGPFMSGLNEKFSKYSRLKDLLDRSGLESALTSVAQSGDLGTEVLLLLRRSPSVVKLEHACIVMQIAVRTFDSDHELAIATVEGMMQAFGKLVHASRSVPVPGRGVDPALEERKRRCELFVAAFREIAPRLRTVAAGRSASSQIAGELLEEWRAFLR